MQSSFNASGTIHNADSVQRRPVHSLYKMQVSVLSACGGVPGRAQTNMPCHDQQRNDTQLRRAVMDRGQKLLDCGVRAVTYHMHNAPTAQSMRLE
mmetsp:Transcript_980/g.1433  ORF Transcript_980/g.1433 Transcript_980/m.1433 type:complete len:95 (-) Transcript_980:139-423(-)